MDVPWLNPVYSAQAEASKMDTKSTQFRIAEIEVSTGASNEKIVGFFRYEQSGKKNGPTIIIVAEIASTLYVYERLLDAINETTEQTRHMISAVEMDPLVRFEKLIQKLNEAVAAFTETEGANISWKRINIFVMELSEGQVCLSGSGQVMNMFLQKQDDNSFRAFDLFGSLEQPLETDPAKPFASLICGDMKAGDVLFVGSNNFERLRNELRLKDRLMTLPAITAGLEIKQDLERRAIPDDFLGAIVACVEIKAPVPMKPEPIVEPREASTASIQRLRDSEKEADTRLSPVMTPSREIEKTRQMVQETANTLKEKVLGLFGRRSTNQSGSAAGMASAIKDPVALAGLRGMNAGYGTIFTKKRKTMAAGAVGVFVLAIIGFAYWRHAKTVSAEIASWNQSFDSVVDLRNRAESDLVYGNELKARAELDQAAKTLSALKTETTERKTKASKTASEITDLRERLKRVVKTDDVNELTALPATAEDGSLSAPVLSKDTAYVVDNSAKQILKINLTTRSAKQIPLPPGAGKIIAGTEGSQTIIFATADSKLYGLNKATDLVKPMAIAGVKSSSTQDVALYASKLYRLDTGSNQIWRSTNAGGAFGAESAYIKASDSPLTDGVAMAIDSSVYVLKTNGQVVQFLSGGQEGFSLANIDPPVRAASGIWTDVDVPILVVTDPADKRVLIYDKSGQLKSQIVSDKLSSPRDVSADYGNKRLLVVDGNRLVLVPMP